MIRRCKLCHKMKPIKVIEGLRVRARFREIPYYYCHDCASIASFVYDKAKDRFGNSPHRRRNDKSV